ncbi:MAG: DHA2 family efflux MFS transporter permease subunit [Pseudomonadales bacterium]|nr:DHA2 family efflux MFS transporter permease subunit [Pseudomonadales bacterium]
MPPVRQRIGFVAAILGLFMAILDIQIVASSLNEIQAGVSATPEEISWIQTAYLIAEVIMIPLSGMLVKVFSTRGAFAISAIGFTFASVGCAMATTLNELVVLRALQGFIGGAMIPIAYTISFGIFPQRVMGSVQAVMGLTATLAPSIGPTLGGFITEHASWHWLFLMNVLPGMIAATGVWLCLDFDKPDFSLIRRFDYLGLLLMALFLGTLEYVLEEGPGDDWFSSDLITTLAIVSCVSGAWFLYRTARAKFPCVDLLAFRNRNFAIGTALGFLLGMALYGLVYLMPLYLGQIRHFNSLQIGEIMFVTGAAMFCTAPIAGRASDKLDPRILLTIGLALVGTGSIMNATLTDHAGYEVFFWPQVVRGMGLVLCIIPITRIALGTLPASELGNASGLFNVMRNLGGAVGLAVMDTVRDIRFDYHWNQIIPAIDAGRTVVAEQLAQAEAMLASTPDPATAALSMMASRVAIQAQTLAFNDIFLWLGVAYLVAVPTMIFMRKPAEQVAAH